MGILTVAQTPLETHPAQHEFWEAIPFFGLCQKPVGDGEIYYIENLNPILLEVRNPGNEPISKVRFYRWVPSADDWVTIGEDLPPSPYRETIDPSELELGWNEIRAFAWGPPGVGQTFSSHPFIFIFKGYSVFLSLTTK